MALKVKGACKEVYFRNTMQILDQELMNVMEMTYPCNWLNKEI